MAMIFRDEFFRFNQYSLEQGEDIFEKILEERKNGIDSERFFLSFIPSEELAKYDFSDKNSLKQFRDVCLTFSSPLKKMGGCNLREEYLSKGIRYAGIKLSDPYGKIPGAFDVRNHIITYSPIFPLFYQERDLIKFANDTYFTSMPFEEIIMNQINNAVEYYVHTGDYKTARDLIKYGSYIFEKVTKEQMIEYATNPEKGELILKKYLNIK